VPKINPEALRAIREKDGRSQVDLAAVSDVAQSHISRMEREVVDVRPATAKALADALRVPMSALLAVEEPAP
jgi:transcriptional regulator with XRE-family HTH domain